MAAKVDRKPEPEPEVTTEPESEPTQLLMIPSQSQR